jgi:xanthine phosphoribosyltransferase
MKLLENRILKDGKVLPGNILKVGSFLNHQIDVGLLIDMGKEVKRLYKDQHITKIITVEASGIAIATAFAAVISVPVVFAKKHSTSNLSEDLYTARVHSYTHGSDYDMVVEKPFISKNDKVLLVDDFLANGAALEGLIKIVEQAGAEIVGCAIAIEKGFQNGGDRIRSRGIRIESLAIIDEMDNNTITFRQ